MGERTHRLLVSAYVIKEGRFLLLHRKNKPILWAPPGGRLEPDEDPQAGVKREVREESGLEVEIIAPVDTWRGVLRGEVCVSIDFVCRWLKGEVQLSEEHDEFCWASLEDLRSSNPDLGDDACSYGLRDFEKAWKAAGRQ